MTPIYLDYNATTPLDPEVAQAMLPYLTEHFGNPSSAHWFGEQTRAAIDKARMQVASLLGCEVDEIIFTSGGSEANNYAIKGYAWAHREKGNHLVASAIEHPAVLEVLKFLKQQGFEHTLLPVDEYGRVSIAEFEAARTPQTILVSLMHANNEVGALQPIAEIAAIAHDAGIALHCDAAQSVGKVPVRVNELGVDMLSIAGHKLYAPKGVGALFVHRGVQLEKLIHGAGHEKNRRAGTENVLEIVGLGEACEIAARDLAKNVQRMRALRERLRLGLQERISDLKFNGHPEQSLPNTLSVSFRGVRANVLMNELRDALAVSPGAACHAEAVTISHVLAAMRVPEEFALGTLRLSLGKMTTEAEVDRAIEVLIRAVRKLARA
jgi:cysteine desulfurase